MNICEIRVKIRTTYTLYFEGSFSREPARTEIRVHS